MSNFFKKKEASIGTMQHAYNKNAVALFDITLILTPSTSIRETNARIGNWI